MCKIIVPEFHPMKEVRWYKGTFKVIVLGKSKRHFLVEAVDPISFFEGDFVIPVGEQFITVARLLESQRR